MAESAKHLKVLNEVRDGIGDELLSATSHDLVFALVGHAGAGASRVAVALIDGLEAVGYEPRSIKLSAQITDTAKQIEGCNFPKDFASRIERTIALQKAGTFLRDRFSASFTAGLAIKAIRADRGSKAFKEKPTAFVIDSLKNPEEVSALRKVYGKSFYVVGVVCGPDVRKVRLTMKYKALPTP